MHKSTAHHIEHGLLWPCVGAFGIQVPTSRSMQSCTLLLPHGSRALYYVLFRLKVQARWAGGNNGAQGAMPRQAGKPIPKIVQFQWRRGSRGGDVSSVLVRDSPPPTSLPSGPTGHTYGGAKGA